MQHKRTQLAVAFLALLGLGVAFGVEHRERPDKFRQLVELPNRIRGLLGIGPAEEVGGFENQVERKPMKRPHDFQSGRET